MEGGAQFIGAEVEVTMAGDPILMPVAFRWENREYTVAEVVSRWFDYGFGADPRPRPKWWQRRHRNYYRVRTTDGQVFELYFDRGTSAKHPERRKWVLYRSLPAVES